MSDLAETQDPVRTLRPVGDGELSILVAGPKEGAPVILLHGMPESAEVWRTVLAMLGDAGYRTYAPDLPGYGSTRLPEHGDRSLAGAAELLATWVRQEHLGPMWVVGHDLGGGIAQILVVRHPGLVNRLTLSQSVVENSWPVTPIRLFRFIAQVGLYGPLARAGMVPNAYAWWALRRGFADPTRLDAAVARTVFWDGKVTDPRGRQEFAKHLAALDSAQTVEVAPYLKGVKVPTLLLWAKEDRYQPWDPVGKRLQELLPSADVAFIQDAGHFVILENPTAYLDALLAWCDPQRRLESGKTVGAREYGAATARGPR